MQFKSVFFALTSFALFARSNCSLNELFARDPNVFGVEPRSDISTTLHSFPPKRLVAARSVPEIGARDLEVDRFLGHSHVLHFIEDDSESRLLKTQSPFAAHVRLAAKLPILVLESHDRHLAQVVCHGSTIELTFHTDAVCSLAWTELKEHDALLIITSHPGCNVDGERRPFLVSGVEIASKSLILSVTLASWKDDFHTIEVDFETHDDNARFKRSDHLKKRQAAVPFTTSSTASSSTATSTIISSVAFPPPPSSSPTITSVSDASINKQYLDTAILPPDFPGVDSTTLHAPFLPHGISVKCKNCTVQGNINISHGSFTLNEKNSSSNSSDNVINFYENGFVGLQVDNFAAHIELESTVEPSTTLVTYTAPFPDIGIPGFIIPGIAEVGPVLRPRVTFGVQLSSTLDFIYGFNLTIPNNSSLILNINHPQNSTISGFQDTQISSLPLQSQVDNINLTLSAAFDPQLLLEIAFLENAGSVGAGAFLDLPQLTATISQVDHVNAKCEPMNATDNAKDFPFNSLTHIDASVNLDTGVLADAALQVGAYGVAESTAVTLWSTSYPMPTACFNYDPNTKGYGIPPSNPVPSSSPGSKSESASTRSRNPLIELWEHTGRVTGMLVFGGAALIGFGVL